VDWIERLFGFAPDNGDGTIELLLVVVATVCVAAAVGYHPRVRQTVQKLLGRGPVSTP